MTLRADEDWPLGIFDQWSARNQVGCPVGTSVGSGPWLAHHKGQIHDWICPHAGEDGAT